MNTWMELQQIQEQGQGIQERQHLPPFFPWPVSHPGPWVTPPPPGYVPVPSRSDQVMMVVYALEREYLRALVDGTI